MEHVISEKEFFESLCTSTAQRSCFVIGNGFNKYMQEPAPASQEEDRWDWANVIRKIAGKMPSSQIDMKALFAPGISNLERINLLDNLNMRSDGKQLNSVIVEVIKELETHFSSEKSCGMLDFAWQRNHHIMTTNFDHNIETYLQRLHPECSLACHKFTLSGHGKKTDGNTSEKRDKTNKLADWYFSTRLSYGWNKFCGDHPGRKLLDDEDVSSLDSLKHDLWYIHGTYHLRDSNRTDDTSGILFSLKDYLSAVQHVRDFGVIDGCRPWGGRDTWVSLFMHCPLIIAGFAYSSEEFFLRHLLLYKAWYVKQREKKGMMQNSYYLRAKNTMENDASDFLSYLGFKIVEFNSFDELYNHQLWRK